MTTTFETASIGERVWSLTLGWGVITHTLYEDRDYPIQVEFDSGRIDAFTEEGLLYSDDINQTLFWDEIKFEVPTKPLPILNKDDCVEVWNANILSPTKTDRRHFSHFEDDIIFCFQDGKTSWTSNRTVGWHHWRKPE